LASCRQVAGRVDDHFGITFQKKKLVQDVHLASDFQAMSGQVLVQQYVLVTFLLRICTNTYNAAWVAAQKGKDVADYA
jgi:chemotaxis regulatin CheY-phosphate phosphatase CheZ